jgi:hypothetical protein
MTVLQTQESLNWATLVNIEGWVIVEGRIFPKKILFLLFDCREYVLIVYTCTY